MEKSNSFVTVDQLNPETLPKEEQMKALFSVVTNYSRAKRVARALLGPTSRVWHRREEGVVQVGYEEGGSKQVAGQGATFADALVEASKELSMKELVSLVRPELTSAATADARAAAEKAKRQ